MTTDIEEIPIEIIPDSLAVEKNESKIDKEVQNSEDTPKLTKKELQKIERQKQREIERVEKERKKEEERKRKEEDKLRKQKEKELERELKKQKLEEEKAEKEKKREEERLEREAKKEEERLIKQQAIDAREQARLAKKRKLEEEKEEREVQRRRLEDDKKRKEESQKKISSFFTVKKQPVEVVSPQTAQIQEFETNDYKREFLPLFVQKNMKLAKSGQLSSDELVKSKDLFDNLVSSNSSNDFQEVNEFFNSKRRNININKTTITPDDVIALLNSSTATEAAIYQVINQFPPIKYISFYENSKPPYVGTWCSIEHQKTKLSAKDPLDTSLTGLDYDYDSDLEWNKEDEEGEDVDDEDDEEEEDTIIADEDDLGFVEDDQQINQAKRFHSMNVIVKLNDGTNDDFFKSITTTPTEVNIRLPIDPFNALVNESPKKVANNIETKKKSIIEDPKIISQIITFYDSKELGSFSINTILELVMKNFQYTDKALVRNTLHHILRKDRQTSTWVVKKLIREDPGAELKA